MKKIIPFLFLFLLYTSFFVFPTFCLPSYPGYTLSVVVYRSDTGIDSSDTWFFWSDDNSPKTYTIVNGSVVWGSGRAITSRGSNPYSFTRTNSGIYSQYFNDSWVIELVSSSNYDSSISSGLLWHNSFYLSSNDTYEVVSFSHTLSGNVLNGDNKSTILEIYVNDVQKDVITKVYNPLNSVFDGINFHHSDYGINNGDTIRVRAYYYLNNNYGNYKEISWIAKNKLDNSDNLITNPSGNHGGGGSERNPIETTIKNPYTPSTPTGQPPKELAPVQTTITQQQVIEVNPTTEQTVTIQNIYIQGYEIPDYPNYEDQLKTIEELLKGVNSGDTITNITNNYEYTYNYNFDFDIDFGDLNLDQQDLKSFIQDFPSFSEKYISFLSSFGVPVWLVVLIVSCFGLIFVALLIKIVKLVLPI